MDRSKTYLANALSLAMVAEEAATEGVALWVNQLAANKAANYLANSGEIINAVGHVPTDEVIRSLMADYGVSLPKGERINISLKRGDSLVVAQWMGGRLEEGQVITDLQLIRKNLKFFLVILPE